MQSAVEHIFLRRVEPDVSHSHPSPAARDGEKNFGSLLDERLLLFQRKHQIAVTLFGGGQCGKNSASDAKIRLAHVRTFFSIRQAERDPSEVGYFHEVHHLAEDWSPNQILAQFLSTVEDQIAPVEQQFR